MAFVPRLDFNQLELEAQRRWLRPAEISEILRNYHDFQISTEPPNKPPSGSLFLFDRKVLRYFRKDGHNWRKKGDGKTIKEAHEKLKVGSVDVLHCYYAHGEENENFQRRCYWLLQQDMMHIVFVHYLEVKGNKMNVGDIRERNEVISNIVQSSPLSYSSPANHTEASSGITDSTSPTSTLASSSENADSGHDGEDSHQVSSRSYSFLESLQMQNVPMMENIYSGLSNSTFLPPNSDYASHDRGDRPRDDDECISIFDSQRMHSLGSWEEILKYCTRGNDDVPSHVSIGVTIEGENTIHSELLAGETAVEENYGSALPVQSNFQIPFAENSLQLSKGTMDRTSNVELEYELGDELFEQRTYDAALQSAPETIYNLLAQQNGLPMQNNLQQLRDAESQCLTKSDSESEMHRECNVNYSLSVKQKLLDREGGLEKADSFSRWVTKELEDVDDLHMQSSSGLSWNTAECGHVAEDSSVSPFLSQDQLFSIIDFSPKWAYRDSNVEVVVIGKFLESQLDIAKCNWSCMFGEEEVPADILADGVLCCHAPPHTVGRVPFYITCSNRLACSEVREFEYVVGSVKDVDILDIYGGGTNEINLHLRLEKLLAMRSLSSPSDLSKVVPEKQQLISKIISLKEEEESYQMGESTVEKNISQLMVKEQLLHKLMKEKLFPWVLHKVIEDGKGPNILDDEGQGVLHLAAALGYDWVIKPTVTAGVSINFRDVNGWTALHWAAFYGREQSVAVLISLGAAPGALTDPSPEFPLGRSPADLASSNGHKGISGFLAESSLTSHLSSLTMNDSTDSTVENTRARAVLTVSDRTATPLNDGDVSDELCLKDSLTAICNATQAADRIHQVFRMQSFQRKQLTELGADDFGMLDEQAFSLFTAKAHRAVQGEGLVHAAALRIQKKFRGWKKRREFLLIRQRIVKIQAHVRGHQVRKQYRSIIWSVGILEKVILRWRRKGSGLRGFRRDAVYKHPDPKCVPLKEDDYDFLKEGKRQTEERLQKALDRVKSMVRYPEGRAQYRRLLTVVEGFHETKACDMEINSSEELIDGDQDLIGIDSLLNDDTFMSIGFE